MAAHLTNFLMVARRDRPPFAKVAMRPAHGGPSSAMCEVPDAVFRLMCGTVDRKFGLAKPRKVSGSRVSLVS